MISALMMMLRMFCWSRNASAHREARLTGVGSGIAGAATGEGGGSAFFGSVGGLGGGSEGRARGATGLGCAGRVRRSMNSRKSFGGVSHVCSVIGSTGGGTLRSTGR